MKQRARLAVSCLVAVALALSNISVANADVANSYDLNACVTAINDPLYTRDTIATKITNPNGHLGLQTVTRYKLQLLQAPYIYMLQTGQDKFTMVVEEIHRI